jgi:signal peptidase I
MKKALLVLITFLLAVSVQAQQRDRLGELDVVCRNEINDTLQSGDLIFLNNNRSDMEKAITASTVEYSHVALVERDSTGDVWVIEASTKYGVQRIPYNQFERENNLGFFRGNIDIYRLTVPFDTAAVITRAKKLVGKSYDNAFLPDNDAYYCSELIQVAFGDIFPSRPMNWRDDEGNLPEYWIKHFEELGLPVPEGVPGTNPTDMSRSPLLKMLK